MGRLFGTDGVRGIANRELTPELAFKLGKAGTFILKKENKRPIMIIGKDTRVSGDMLENALTAGILAVGGNVIKVGVLPTPAIAFLTRHYGADAGIVISASHNSFEYNGIKFFNGDGYKLDDLLEEKIEDIIISSVDVNSHITGDLVGKCLEAEEDARRLYEQHLLETVNYKLDGKKIVLDCANGVSDCTAGLPCAGRGGHRHRRSAKRCEHQCCLRVNAPGGSGCKSTGATGRLRSGF